MKKTSENRWFSRPDHLSRVVMEATPRLGLGVKVLQTSALPLGYDAIGADYGARTRHLDLGKVALYQMS